MKVWQHVTETCKRILLAQTLWSQPICSMEIGEVLGLLHAINWVHDLQLNNVDF